MLEVSNADIALLNSGTLRSDKIHPKGDFKLRDLLTILPLVDLLIVIQVKGKFIKLIEGGRRDLQLPVQSVPITTNIVSLNPALARCTRYNICDKVCQ